MRISICAVGRIRPSPEKHLIDNYKNRFDKLGRNLNLGPLSVIEVEDKKKIGMAAEALLLQRSLPDDCYLTILDERGEQMTSTEFAKFIEALRDNGLKDLAFVIGGADGLDPSIKSQRRSMLSFGKMVWPHFMARAMLCEQIYRSGTILAGKPYHRA
ncbi:MAG: 23S rRNA (pseudouridine(1915)-N(3))-methyltransferase RlmH [Aestuariivita sp.]|nr:23S rRNA (pseudouridine(1915)-N(3))-methyltransferase RlmH [Aestuariivita sp.]